MVSFTLVPTQEQGMRLVRDCYQNVHDMRVDPYWADTLADDDMFWREVRRQFESAVECGDFR